MLVQSRFPSRLGVSALILALGACGEGPAAPESQSDLPLEASLEQMAAEANNAGDVDAAVAFSDGLLAIRLGVRPTELSVKVGDKSERYLAIVTGVAHTTADGAILLRRSLVAWAGDPRPTALLQVTSFSDNAVFGYPSDLATRADPVGRARGTWVNLVRGHTFVATSGRASIALASTGEACPNLPADSRLRCAVARYDVGIDGVFHQLRQRNARQADHASRIEISTEGGVAGVVITRIP
ncbi:MAG TPA: hypothetical protein VGA78_04095 [Gemmatimonadales bacterium]